MMRLLLLLTVLIGSQNSIWGQNSWLDRAELTGFKREQAVGFSIGNKGYVGTGVDTSETVLKDFWEYDPILDSWTQKADLAGVARRNAIGFGFDDKGYLGTGLDNDEALTGVKLNDFWEYTPATNSWVQKANFPGSGGLGIYYATAFTADSKGYICGGKLGPSLYTSEMWEYKPSIDQWTMRASFPGGIRYNMSSLTVNNVAFVGLGTDQNNYRNDWWKYNPATNIWVAQPNFIGGARGGASTFTIGSKGYVCLGTNGGLKDDLWEFDPILETWSPRANFGGSQRKQAISFSIGNRGFVGTGSGVSGKKRTFFEYVPAISLGTDELSDVTITCFPNPATDFFQIQTDQAELTKAVLYSSQGQIVASYSKDNSNWNCSRNGLPAGAYYLVLQTELGENRHQQTIQFID